MNTLKIEPGKKFISIYKEDDYYSYEIYESNDDTEFHIEERDWNFDNDVYPQCIAYFYDSDRCYSIVTIEEFKESFIELTRKDSAEGMFLNISDGIVYSMMYQFQFNNDTIRLMKRYADDSSYIKLIDRKQFESEFREITFK